MANLWKLYQEAKLWKVRPSQLFGIDNDYYAYCLDEVVAAWGSHVTSELDKVEGKDSKDAGRKRQRKLLQLLQAPDEMRFRSLRTPTKKK